MAINRRLHGYSGIRVDIPHLKSIESSVSFDFDSVLRGMFTGIGRPYLLRGFRIKIPTASIPATSLQIEVADSAVLHSSATESGTILTVPAGTADETLNANNSKIIGSFQANSLNYVSLDYRRVTDNSTVDQTAGWSASQKIEYQRSAPIGRVLQYRFIISTAGFSTNLPLYIVKTNNNNQVEYITKAVPSFFRLGTGGANPNPANSFGFGNLTNPQTGNRREWITTGSGNPLTAYPLDPQTAFDLGDFAIKNMKDWMDAIMTRFKEITGSNYWYLNQSLPEGELTLANVWWDSVGSVMTGTGELSYNLVLETNVPSTGRYQDFAHDPTITAGDVYAKGKTSGTKATLTSYNIGQLIINSLTSAGFTVGESVELRRLFRPSSSKYSTSDFSYASDIWSNVAVYNTDDLVFYSGKVYRSLQNGNINQQPDTTPAFWEMYSNRRYAHFRRKAYSNNAFTAAINSWSYTNVNGKGVAFSEVTVDTVAAHGFNPGDIVRVVGLSATKSIAPNGTVSIKDVPSSTSFTFYSPIIQQGTTSVLMTNGVAIESTDRIPYIPRFNVSSWSYVGANITAVVPDHNFKAPLLTIGDTTINSENITNITSTSNLKVGMKIYGTGISAGSIITKILSSTSVEMSQKATATNAATALTFADVINTSGLLCTSNAPNGTFEVSALGPGYDEIQFTAGATPVGTPTVTANSYIKPDIHQLKLSLIDADPVEFNVTDAEAYALSDTDVRFVVGSDALPALGTAVGLMEYDGVVADSIVNEQVYPGPIEWSEDIIVKGIVGDKSFTVPKTAIAYSTLEDPNVSPDANDFNINGKTGTLYIKNGEVAYIVLERNKSVSNGASWSTTGGSNAIVGSTPPTDEDGNNLVAGDFVKFEDEDEGKWLKIAGTPGAPILTNSFNLIDDSGNPPNITHRPAKSGKLVYSKGIYSKVYVKKHYLVNLTGDIYWLAIRRDNGGSSAKIYFRSLEVEAGEVRQINDNQITNLLKYTGANSEAAINPNYSISDTAGDYQFSQTLTIEDINHLTRMVTFYSDAGKMFQQGDRVVFTTGPDQYFFTIKNILTTRTVILAEETTPLSINDDVEYHRLNKNVNDQDNLTLALRKEDRELGQLQSVLNRPVYNESVFPQQINLSGLGTVRSGSYIYKGSQTNPTALAWVLHGNAAVNETIETVSVSMPGGHFSVGASAVLVHIVFGSFSHGDGLFQNGSSTGCTVNNPGNPPFSSPSLFGGTGGTGIELVLPPNKRTQVVGSEFLVFGAPAVYKASMDLSLTGEDLLVIVNDGIREAGLDYEEVFGGPKAKIRLVRSCPPNSRLRFRILSSFGSALAAKAGNITLQDAYNGGSTIQCVSSRPVEITAANVNAGEEALVNRGSILINGGASQLGGIFNETVDKGFVIGKEDDKPKESWTALEALKSHDSHPDSATKRKTAAQTVTGASGTIITDSAITLTDGQAYRIMVKATARRSDGPLGVASFSMEGTFYRSGGGALAAGSPISIINGADGDGLSYALAFGLSGNDVVAVGYGSAGATVQWVLTIEWQAVGLAS